MTNNTSGYILADVKGTQHVVRTVGFSTTKKVARNLRTNLNTFTARKAKKIIKK